MATLSLNVGYEYEFVEQVPEDYFCKLCKHVAREPNLTTCCGEIICKACVDDITQDKKPCLSCGDSNTTSFPHVKYQRKILALEVRCTMKDRGCPWTGQLQHLDAHLEVTTGDCEYVDVECPKKCVQKVQKRYVDTHLANECPNRDYRCPHCNFENKFHVVSNHFDVCPYYPLACPNRCGATFERDDLEDHMKMCRLEKVQCVFDNAGCQAKFIRENEDEHMDQNTQKHLALMPAATLRISQDFEQKLQEQQETFEKKLKEQNEELCGQLNGLQETLKVKDLQIRAMEERLQTNDLVIEQQLQTIKQMCRAVGIPPYDITLSNYQEVKAQDDSIDSTPMFTHPGGYKFILTLRPNGIGVCKGAQVSVTVCPLKSYHDTELKFPVKFTITVQLLNQHRDQDHHTRDILYERKTMEGVRNWENIGYNWRVISHAALEWNCDKQTQYLKDDCLKFRVTKIVVH